MNEDDVVIDQLEAEPIETDSGPIEDFLKAIEDQNFTQAERQFNDIVGSRLQDTLDQAKIKIASAIHDEAEDDDDVNDDDDEDLEDILGCDHAGQGIHGCVPIVGNADVGRVYGAGLSFVLPVL